VDGLSNLVVFLLSPGNNHDFTHAVEVLRKVQIEGSNVLGDRANGSQEIREYITDHGVSYTIPPKKAMPPIPDRLVGGSTRTTPGRMLFQENQVVP